MTWMQSIGLGKKVEFTSNGRIYDLINERLNLWFNRLYAYSKLQPILSFTCLILFFCLILILLIYRFKRTKTNSDGKKVHISEEKTFSLDKKRLEQTTMTTKKQLKNTKGKLIDYDQTKNDKNDKEFRYESEYDGEFSSKNDTTLNYQNNQNDQKDQIKQFKRNYLMNQRDQQNERNKLNQFAQMNEHNELNRTNQINTHNVHNIGNYHNQLNHSIQLNGKVDYGTKFSKDEINRKFEKRFKCKNECGRDQLNSRLRSYDLDKNGYVHNEYDENRLDACLKNQTRSKHAGLDECCCCLSGNKELIDHLRLSKRKQYLEQQLGKEFCDCIYCANDRSSIREYNLDKKLDVRLSGVNERNPNQNCEDDLASVHAVSYGSCSLESDCECRRQCKISKLIKDNISTRSNNSSTNEQLNNLNKQLFDHEYRRLVKRNRQIKRSDENCSCVIDNPNNSCLTGYTSWSSHLHVQ